eukprot:CAMPEP_0180517726 /NCGR_PEP_ID=MMETSP1036_2-20121128/54692_1 /TAXON_ID=632150 /ORGANISM="Azadinium spinosum, Strain 3D9" /LENGTH=34 /DNA_ID= /DNA_START= /DNA_END= /DNA_ORIENTATION=
MSSKLSSLRSPPSSTSAVGDASRRGSATTAAGPA